MRYYNPLQGHASNELRTPNKAPPHKAFTYSFNTCSFRRCSLNLSSNCLEPRGGRNGDQKGMTAKGIRALFSMIKCSLNQVLTATLYVNILKITELCISRGIILNCTLQMEEL